MKLVSLSSDLATAVHDGHIGHQALLVEPTVLPSTCCTTLALYRTMQFREGMSLKLRSSGDNRPVSTIQSCTPRQIANTSRETGLSPSSPIVTSVQGESWDCVFESGTRHVKPFVVLIVSGATVASLASRQAVAPKSIASTLAAASSCMCGRT